MIRHDGQNLYKLAGTAALDIIERGDVVEVQVELPGIDPESVTIEFDQGLLTIAAQPQQQDDTLRYTRRERYHGAYQRTLRVPDTYNVAQATAAFENGVLYLTLPKKPEAQPVRIPVNTVHA